jgi:acetolactate synthase-1/2/3 large subunit
MTAIYIKQWRQVMNGAESLIQTLINGGVELCFANPGTSEMHFVAAGDKIEGMRIVLGLFEGVCTAAADGYARMARKPAATLLHLGPGLGNGLANLHNGRRANSPVVNIVGDHATYHLKHDAPLTSDIESMAMTISSWVRTSKNAESVPLDGAEAISAAVAPPGHVATLILPADCSWKDSTGPAPVPPMTKAPVADQKTIRTVAGLLQGDEPTVMLLAGSSLMEKGLRFAGRICRSTGARMIAARGISRIQRGAGRTAIDILPYFVKPALKMLEGASNLVLVEAAPPVSFFAWPNTPNWLTPEDCQIHTLASVEEDGVGTLAALAEELDAPEEPAEIHELDRPDLPIGELTAEKVWIALSALMPEHAIISDESVTSGASADRWTCSAPPYDCLYLTGGSIGQGMPVATGAAVACPNRKVFSMEADGSAMYTLQSLWTQAHEGLDVVTVIFANQSYRILHGELERVGVPYDCPKARSLFDLTNPNLEWVDLAKGMGVHATQAKTAERLVEQLEAAIHTPGPHLIEAMIKA